MLLLRDVPNPLDPDSVHRSGTTKAPSGIDRLMLNLLGAFAEFGRTLIRERKREDIRIAKAAGKHTGRNRKRTDDQIAEEPPSPGAWH
ncbi:recombinase family protein [Curtobacterium sp. PhB78]|uniref:recombinase family protein n=1 Tax=Curtobacterium sp. PhB78 TaxID=2485102 RepID=UPI0021A5553F|nr:recombinase family protein [Curtobacterium sp. PhB78]